MRGTLGFGHDSGIGPENILSAIVRSPEIKYYTVSALKWNKHGQIENLLVSVNEGETYVYTGDCADDDDPVSIIGDVHSVRKIGKYIKEKANHFERVSRGDNLHERSSFGWMHGYAPYDSFSPYEIVGDLVKLEQKYKVVSNPNLHSSSDHSLNKLFTVINNDCFVIGRTDSVNIIGWNVTVSEVAIKILKTFGKNGRKLFDMTKLEEVTA